MHLMHFVYTLGSLYSPSTDGSLEAGSASRLETCLDGMSDSRKNLFSAGDWSSSLSLVLEL